MIDIEYKGINYRLILNKNLFNCLSVLFVGYLFIENKRYKKYVNYNKDFYLLEV